MIHLFLLFSLSSSVHAATADSEFAKYPSPVETAECKSLDFNSYHKVQNVKANMLKLNPDIKHANFAGKYLLLKNEFLFDTVWFVADCSTGKFIKEMLSTDHKNPVPEFKAESSLLAIHSDDPKNTTPLEFHVFQNEKWRMVDASPAATPTPANTPAIVNATTPAPSPSASPSHEESFAKYPAKNGIDTCKELDFSSFYRATEKKNNLIENTPDRSKPNFGGHYLILKADTIFQNLWFMADCNTGKFFPDILTGNTEFQKDSILLKFFSSGSYPTFRIWSEEDQQWIKLSGSNSIQGGSAKPLWDSLPHPDKSNIVRFENHKFTIAGVELLLKSGRCSNENKKFVCDFEN